MAESQTLTEEQRNEFLFTQLVLMFQGATIQQLGKIKNPITDKIERDLDQARNTIDIIGMLEAKTKGNLTEREVQFLAHMLSELRLNYVDELNKPQEPAESEQDTEPEAKTEEKPEEPSDAETKA